MKRLISLLSRSKIRVVSDDINTPAVYLMGEQGVEILVNPDCLKERVRFMCDFIEHEK